MKKYQVRVCIPSVYEVEAEDYEQAEKKAKKLFKKDNKTWIEPEIHPDWRVYEKEIESEEEYLS